ncbi:hypothetical protein BDV12DRAFT_203227 [Aspergillus spectabilis]
MAGKKGKGRGYKEVPYVDFETDEDLLGTEGEEQALRQVRRKLPPGARDISRYLTIQRPIDWTNPEKPGSMKTYKNRIAAVLQRRGDEVTPSCTQCRTKDKAFKACVAAPVVGNADTATSAFQRGACANCIFDSRDGSCSLVGSNFLLDSTSISQYVAEGFDLREALEQDDSEEEVLEEEEDEKEKEKRVAVNGNQGAKRKARVVAAAAPVATAGGARRPVQAIPSSTFFGAFHPDRAFARVGISRSGPRCEFDGDELQFPISKEIWDNPRRLLSARSDLATFVSVVDARLYETGQTEDPSEYTFWRAEAQRLSGMYQPSQKALNAIVNRERAPDRPAAGTNGAPGRCGLLTVPRVITKLSPMLAPTVLPGAARGAGVAGPSHTRVAAARRPSPLPNDRALARDNDGDDLLDKIAAANDQSSAASSPSPTGKKRAYPDVFESDDEEDEASVKAGEETDAGERTDAATWDGGSDDEDESEPKGESNAEAANGANAKTAPEAKSASTAQSQSGDKSDAGVEPTSKVNSTNSGPAKRRRTGSKEELRVD